MAVVLAVLFAGVGFIEYYRKTLFLNPKVVAANQYDNYFRVNSVFFDPSIYGRFLAIVMIARDDRRAVEPPAARRAVGARRARVAAGGARDELLAVEHRGAAAGAGGARGLPLGRARDRVRGGRAAGDRRGDRAAAPASLHFGLKGSGGSTSNATSGRTKLISGGLELFAERPLEGYGSGSFETEYKRHGNASAANATSASHTIPITVAAEQGIIGLALYVALLIAAFAVLFRGAGRSPPRIAIAACFAALVLHTWTYADFLEDPITWTLLGDRRGAARRAGLTARRRRAGTRMASRPPVASEPCSAT